MVCESELQSLRAESTRQSSEVFREIKLFVVVRNEDQPHADLEEGMCKKATEFIEDVNVVSVMQDPPKQCGWKEKGSQVAFASAYRGTEGYSRKGVKFVKTEETRHKRGGSMKMTEPFLPNQHSA